MTQIKPSPKQSKLPRKSQDPNGRMYDSITVEDYLSRPQEQIICTIVQKSIRFHSWKKLAVYLFRERAYWGNYEIHSHKEYKFHNLPNLLCVMVFGKPKEKCHDELKQLYTKGKFTHDSSFYFITMYKIGYNKSHIIKHKS